MPTKCIDQMPSPTVMPPAPTQTRRAQPLAVGCESQLIEWVLEDAARWTRLESAAPAKPVILYPQPTVFSAHPLAVVDDTAPAPHAALRDAMSITKRYFTSLFSMRP